MNQQTGIPEHSQSSPNSDGESPGKNSFRVLLGEVTTSAGPRKEEHISGPTGSVELGEDTGGLVFVPDHSALLWVADGTSNMSRKAAFSSRILAQDLGRTVTRLALSSMGTIRSDNYEAPALDSVIHDSVNSVLEEWRNQISSDGSLRSYLEEELQTLNRKGAGNLFFEFSSTLGVGYIAPGGEFRGAGIGDSYLALCGKQHVQFFAMQKGSITLRLRLAENRLDLRAFIPPAQNFSAKNVDLVIFSSDGARESIQHLHESLDSSFQCTLGGFSQLKKNLARIQARTQDDKTMVIVARIHES